MIKVLCLKRHEHYTETRMFLWAQSYDKSSYRKTGCKSHLSDMSPLYGQHDSVLLRSLTPTLYVCVSCSTATGRVRTVTLDRTLSGTSVVKLGKTMHKFILFNFQLEDHDYKNQYG